MKNKKAQEEITGFVLIIIIVSVIFLIFLGISLRNKPQIEKEGKDIKLFLDSSMRYTSDCAVSYTPDYSSIRKLLSDCQNEKKCISGKSSCESLKGNMKGIIESGFNFGEDRAIKGYKFNATYSSNSTKTAKEVIFLNEGNCSSELFRGAEDFTASSPGIISYSLKLCY